MKLKNLSTQKHKAVKNLKNKWDLIKRSTLKYRSGYLFPFTYESLYNNVCEEFDRLSVRKIVVKDVFWE